MGRLDSFLPPLTRIPCAPPPISLARSGFLSVLARAPGSLWRTRRAPRWRTQRALQWRMLGAGAASLEHGGEHREPRGGGCSRWWMRGASRRRARRASRRQTLGGVDLGRERGTDGEIEHQHVVSSSSAALLLGGLRGGCAPRRLLRKPRQEAAASRRRWQARPGRRTRTMTTLPAARRAPLRLHGCFVKLRDVTHTVHGRVRRGQEAQQSRHGRWPP